jgi:hypothetical protein
MGLKTTTFCLGYQQITPNSATGLTVPARATLQSYSGLYSTMGQYAVISSISPVADTFLLAGNLGV